MRFNPIGLLTDDITNIRYIGQQLFLLPLTAYIFTLFDFPRKIKASWVLFLLILCGSILVNSRGLFLTIIAITALASFKQIPDWLHKAYCIIIFCTPLTLLFLRNDFSSGRHCQQFFVREHLSIFGNGIGAYISDLNNRCSELKIDSNYNNVITTSFDNIHIEFIHYFGILMYLIVILYLLSIFIKHNTTEYRVLAFMLFFFLTLNFNLFEFVLLPCLMFLAILPFKKQEPTYNVKSP